MKLSYDPIKDKSNQKKHGFSLARAYEIPWDSALVEIDLRRNYGEPRFRALALIGPRVYAVVYTDRDGSRRIISFRKANHREIKRYFEFRAGSCDADT